jgi:archaemetzincin
VVSTYRIYPSATSPENALRRLFKIVVHEMGHNFGLPHCPKPYCIMADANGKMKLDRERRLCDACKKKLKI